MLQPHSSPLVQFPVHVPYWAKNTIGVRKQGNPFIQSLLVSSAEGKVQEGVERIGRGKQKLWAQNLPIQPPT